MNMGAILFLVVGLICGGAIGWFIKDASVSTTNAESSDTIFKSDHRTSSQSGSVSYHSSSNASSKSGTLEEFIRIENITSSEVAALGEQFSQSLSTLERSRIFDRLIASMTAENALEIRELTKGLSRRNANFIKFNLAYGRIAGEEAVLLSLDSPEKDENLIFQGWASADPEAAKQWLQSIEDQNTLSKKGYSNTQLKRELHEELVKGMYLNNPDETAAYVASLDESETSFAKKSSVHLVNDLVYLNGPEAALEWAEKLPSGEVATATYVEIADEWSERDAEAALAWAQSHQNNDQREAALYEVWRNMANGEGGSDPFKAAEKINELPESDDKNQSLAGYANGARERYPETAVEAAMSITNPELRNSILVETARYYFRKDRNGAKEWLATTNLPEEVAAQIAKNANLR